MGSRKAKTYRLISPFFIAGLLLIKVLTWKLVFTHFFPPSLGRKATQQNTRYGSLDRKKVFENKQKKPIIFKKVLLQCVRI